MLIINGVGEILRRFYFGLLIERAAGHGIRWWNSALHKDGLLRRRAPRNDEGYSDTFMSLKCKNLSRHCEEGEARRGNPLRA